MPVFVYRRRCSGTSLTQVLPGIVPSSVPLIPGQGHHGGTAIFVRSDVPFVPQQLHIPLQAVAVKVFLGRLYTLCSLYLPPGVPVVRPDLDGLARVLPSPFFLLGDYNGHHPLWDGDASNPRGILIASFY